MIKIVRCALLAVLFTATAGAPDLLEAKELIRQSDLMLTAPEWHSLATGKGVMQTSKPLALPEHWASDVQRFAKPEVTIYIDWKSFTDNGMSKTLLEPLSRIVQGAAKRWTEVGRSNVRFVWGGISNGLVPSSQAIVVRMQSCKTTDGEAIASAGSAGAGKGLYVTIYTSIDADTNDGRSCSNPEPIKWDFSLKVLGVRSLFGVMVHELGHCLGLIGHTPTSATRYSVMTFDPYAGWPQLFGPWPDDIARLQALYGVPTSLETIVVRKFNGQAAWPVYKALPHAEFGNTTLPIGAVREGTRMAFAYTVPTWNLIMTGIGDLNKNTWNMLGASFSDSAYGISMERGAADYLMAYVEWTGDAVPGGEGPNCQIRLRRSVNRGQDWTAVSSFPASYSSSTPELLYLGNNTWAILYSYFGNSQQTRPASFTGSHLAGNYQQTSPEYRPHFGRLVARVSTDNGVTWGAEITQAANESWASMRSGALGFASDPGVRVASEIEAQKWGSDWTASFSAATTSPALGTSHFSWVSVPLGQTSKTIPWNIPTTYPMSWASGRDLSAQAFNDNGSILITLLPNNIGSGAITNSTYITRSRTSPSMTDDAASNAFYMFTNEPAR
jgi:hypothetical protein